MQDLKPITYPSIHPRPQSGHDVARLIAFYLPQYHQIPENDAAWGTGFTEWTNVRKAEPRITGHYQPHIPLGGDYYNLDDHSTLVRQTELARQYGIYGFCYYLYWFDGKRLLEKPLDEMVRRGTPDFPFCLCWANESWTRRWDGGNNEVIVSQPYEKTHELVGDMLQYFKDPRYIKIDGRALLLIYRPQEIPNLSDVITEWRKTAEQAGIGGLHVSGCLTDAIDPSTIEVLDSLYEFPPTAIHLRNLRYQFLPETGFTGMIHDYQAAIVRQSVKEDAGIPVFRGAMPSWDNSPRRGAQSRIFVNSDPQSFRHWLTALVQESKKKHTYERIIFINAWNEWGEGAHLEPDEQYGFQWLEACADALADAEDGAVVQTNGPVAIWSDSFSQNKNVWLALADAALERGDAEDALDCLASIPQLQPEDPAHLLIKAQALLSLGREEEAKAAIISSVELNPGAPELFLEQGAVLIRLKEWHQADRCIQAALAGITEKDCIYDRLCRWSWREAAQVKARLKREEEAVRFASLVATDTSNAEDYLFLGHILMQFERWEEVIHAQRAALELDPDLHAAHQSLSISLAKIGRYQDALATAEDLLHLSPDDPESHAHLAWVYSSCQRWNPALEACRKALAIDPSSLTAMRQYCHAAIKLDQLDEAAASAERMVEIHPREASAHLIHGHVMVNLQRWDAAADSFRRSLQLDSYLVAARRGLINSLMKEQRYDEAANAVSALHALEGTDLSTLLLYGTALTQAERWAEATQVMWAVLKLDETHRNARKTLINALLKLERFDLAGGEAAHLLPQVTDDVSGLLLCGLAFIKSERWADAANALQRAVEKQPDRPTALRMLTNALVRLERFDTAAFYAEKLIQLQPHDPSVNSLYRRVMNTRKKQ